MLIRFFLLDWILTYIEKPKIEQTPADEVLFYTALLIVCGILFTAIFGVWFIIDKIRGDK